MTTQRRLWRALLALCALLAVALAALAVVLATSGVFDRRPGAWTMPVTVLPGVLVQVNVPGALRLATSPLGRWWLDGAARTTRLGHLRIARDPQDPRALLVRCAPCRINDARLAARTVALPPVTLRVARRAGVESNNVLDLTLASGEVALQAVATLSPSSVDLAWTLPPTALAALYRVLADAVPEARFARIEGRLHASGRLSLPSLRARSTVDVQDAEVGGLNTERLTDGWFTFTCRAADGTPRTLTSGEGERGFVDSAALGALLPAAVLAAEDQRFWRHAGFDPVEIAQALADAQLGRAAAAPAPPDADADPRDDEGADAGGTSSARARRAAPPLRGASTITQQLARTLFTGHERSAARKLREWLYAVEMERTLGKERILLLYLNTVDWGPGLCGARAAARHYFGKRVAQLTPLEAAWLAGILRAPHAAHALQFAAARPDATRARDVLMQMRELPRAQRVRAATQPLVFAVARPR